MSMSDTAWDYRHAREVLSAELSDLQYELYRERERGGILFFMMKEIASGKWSKEAAVDLAQRAVRKAEEYRT